MKKTEKMSILCKDGEAKKRNEGEKKEKKRKEEGSEKRKNKKRGATRGLPRGSPILVLLSPKHA